MYLRMMAKTDARRLERGKKAKRGPEEWQTLGQRDKAPINLPEPKQATGAVFPAQRAFVDGRIRTFNGKEWL